MKKDRFDGLTIPEIMALHKKEMKRLDTVTIFIFSGLAILLTISIYLILKN